MLRNDDKLLICHLLNLAHYFLIYGKIKDISIMNVGMERPGIRVVEQPKQSDFNHSAQTATWGTKPKIALPAVVFLGKAICKSVLKVGRVMTKDEFNTDLGMTDLSLYIQVYLILTNWFTRSFQGTQSSHRWWMVHWLLM